MFNIPDLTMNLTISYDLTPYLLDTRYKYYINNEEHNLTDLSAGNCGSNS